MHDFEFAAFAQSASPPLSDGDFRKDVSRILQLLASLIKPYLSALYLCGWDGIKLLKIF